MSVLYVQMQEMRSGIALLADIKKRLLNIQNRMNGIVPASAEDEMKVIHLLLKKQCLQISHEVQSMTVLQEFLNAAIEKYTASEKKLMNPALMEENPAFDEEGSYGGNQSGPLESFMSDEENRQELGSIVRKYFPFYSDRQIQKLLSGIEKEGCGYVALINTIFGRFAGREAEFKRTFGFPMYDKNGDLNFNAIVTDLYCAEDHPFQTGTTRDSREQIWENYLREHDISVDVRNVEVTKENFEKLSQEGEIIVGINPCILYDLIGRKMVSIDGGHAMTVTGITENGMLKVSSWGEEYYIKLKSSVYHKIQFQQVCY